MPTGHIEFDKPQYAPGEPITMRMVVEGAAAVEDVVFTGSFTVSSQSGVATGTTRVGDVVDYGEVTAPGYDVAQDPDDPSRYVATRVAA